LSLGAQGLAILGAVVGIQPLTAVLGQVGGYALAKLMYTPRGVALVNRALSLSAKAPTMSGAAAARAAWGAVANAAQAMPARPPAPAPLVFPRAADRQGAQPQ
jgi:hypothetical protein